MPLPTISQLKQLSPDELTQWSTTIGDAFGDPALEEEYFAVLKPVVEGARVDELYTYRETWLQWYTRLGWEQLVSLSPEDVALLLSKTLFDALLYDTDALREIMQYLEFRSIDDEMMQKKYHTIRSAVLSADAIVCKKQKENTFIRVGDVITQMKTFERTEDSLAESEYYAELQECIEAEVVRAGAFIEAFEVVERLREVLAFFVGVEPKNIYSLVQVAMYPEQFRARAPEAQAAVESVPAAEDNSALYKDIQHTILQEFADQTTGKLTNIEGVMERLNVLADQYGDDWIRDLYYYDEGLGTFHWNDELLQ